ncbi:MAG TPA: MFS transporter, partial [Cytophagales bacterium]|nr:MFS transporter [Cytophagales bacterium]
YILQNFLANNSGYAIVFAGVLLILASLATLLIKSEKGSAEVTITQSFGH